MCSALFGYNLYQCNYIIPQPAKKARGYLYFRVMTGFYLIHLTLCAGTVSPWQVKPSSVPLATTLLSSS